MPVSINLQNLLSYLVWLVTWLGFVRESAEGQCYILCCRYTVVMCFCCVGCSESNVQIGVAHENERHITSLYQNVWRGWECMLLTEHGHGCECLGVSVIILDEQPDVKAQWCKCENWCQLLQDWEVGPMWNCEIWFGSSADKAEHWPTFTGSFSLCSGMWWLGNKFPCGAEHSEMAESFGLMNCKRECQEH